MFQDTIARTAPDRPDEALSTTRVNGAPPVPKARPDTTYISLRRRLAAVDLLALAVSVSAVLGPVPPWNRVPVQFVAVAVTMGALATQGLYSWRTVGNRAADLQGIAHASIAGAAAAAVTARVLDVDLPAGRYVTVALIAFVLVGLCRSLFGGWLRASRASGRLIRRLLLVGGNDEAAAIDDLMRTHPEYGYTLCGYVAASGDDAVAAAGTGLPRLGGLDDAVAAFAASGASGVIVASTAVPFDRLQGLTRELLAVSAEVQVSTGLRGLSHRRLRWQSLAHEPVVSLQVARGTGWHVAGKRALDIVLASLGIVAAAPIILAAAIAIKLEDGGPVVFRNKRVGRHGKSIDVLKLRTMVPDAEQRLAALMALNNRDGGPLFKLERDPRVTRVGSFLRHTSLDELPQLVNVLKGDMSIVGPRPALAKEVAQFDDELRSRRLAVRPGITGLWQAEARDNPAFGAYRRLDLFYVENWSIGFDLAILWATAGRVLARSVGKAPTLPVVTPLDPVARLESSVRTGES
jgi:exopolysaccharide biosynthesis polyprenyl glycosylphosphotransferase